MPAQIPFLTNTVTINFLPPEQRDNHFSIIPIAHSDIFTEYGSSNWGSTLSLHLDPSFDRFFPFFCRAFAFLGGTVFL